MCAHQWYSQHQRQGIHSAMQLLGAWHFSQMKKKWQAHENSCCVELQRPILPPMALPNHDPTSPNLLQGPVFIACLIYHSFQACKIPVYEFTDWKLPLVAFTHLIRNSFTTCRGSFNYLLMTETWKLYHVHYKRSIYTSQSTLPFIPLASLDSHMAWGLIIGIHGLPQRVLICLTNSEICCDFHLVKKVQVKILKSTTKSKKKNHQAKFSHKDTAFHECTWWKQCLGNSK